MRVGLVRSVALGMVALVGFAGCDDNPTDFDSSATTSITTNPSAMVVNAGTTALLDSRTINAGDEPTWEEISAAVDGSCGHSDISVATAATFEPSIQPPGQFDVTAGSTLGASCVALSGGGATDTVDVTVVGDSVAMTAPDTLNLNESTQLGVDLLGADGSSLSPFDPATDIVWASDNEDALTVDADGLLTAAGIGNAVISATWTGSGVTRTSEIPIAVNSPTLEIVDSSTGEAYEDSLLVLTSVDLDANLINPTDPPAEFGPFDQMMVTWETSDADIVSVDADGVATAEGPGTATITATWTGNETVQAEVDIPVDVPAPSVTSTDIASGEALETVTITGTDFIPGAHTVLVDGELVSDFYSPTVTSTTTATVDIPGGAAADLDISVGIPGVDSNSLTVSRVCGTVDESCATEPDNDETDGAPDLGALPVSFAGYVDGADLDLLELTLASETTFTIDLAWTGDSDDMDV
ncbi:MAG: Ig-like domain-containing protein, partial [Gemmatimonadota bacterium]